MSILKPAWFPHEIANLVLEIQHTISIHSAHNVCMALYTNIHMTFHTWTMGLWLTINQHIIVSNQWNYINYKLQVNYKPTIVIHIFFTPFTSHLTNNRGPGSPPPPSSAFSEWRVGCSQGSPPWDASLSLWLPEVIARKAVKNHGVLYIYIYIYIYGYRYRYYTNVKLGFFIVVITINGSNEHIKGVKLGLLNRPL